MNESPHTEVHRFIGVFLSYAKWTLSGILLATVFLLLNAVIAKSAIVFAITLSLIVLVLLLGFASNGPRGISSRLKGSELRRPPGSNISDLPRLFAPLQLETEKPEGFRFVVPLGRSVLQEFYPILRHGIVTFLIVAMVSLINRFVETLAPVDLFQGVSIVTHSLYIVALLYLGVSTVIRLLMTLVLETIGDYRDIIGRLGHNRSMRSGTTVGVPQNLNKSDKLPAL